MSALVAWGLAALVPCARAARAQSGAAPVAPTAVIGARVRLWELAAHDLAVPIVGRLAGVTSDSVDIRPEGERTTLAVPRPAVRLVQTSAGRGTASRWPTAGIGAVIGGLGGGILGVVAGNLSRSNAARLGIYSAIGGIGVGAAVGAASPGEVWRPASLPSGAAR